ncbi:MAG: hypothetical protein FWG79_03200 [Bacteroidales bacterium]|nr:hypothetical protein [Bacteroidales bacterium]
MNRILTLLAAFLLMSSTAQTQQQPATVTNDRGHQYVASEIQQLVDYLNLPALNPDQTNAQALGYPMSITTSNLSEWSNGSGYHTGVFIQQTEQIDGIYYIRRLTISSASGVGWANVPRLAGQLRIQNFKQLRLLSLDNAYWSEKITVNNCPELREFQLSGISSMNTEHVDPLHERSLEITNCPELYLLSSTHCLLTNFVLNGSLALQQVTISGTDMPSIDFSDQKNLTNLTLSSNRFSEITLPDRAHYRDKRMYRADFSYNQIEPANLVNLIRAYHGDSLFYDKEQHNPNKWIHLSEFGSQHIIIRNPETGGDSIPAGSKVDLSAFATLKYGVPQTDYSGVFQWTSRGAGPDGIYRNLTQTAEMDKGILTIPNDMAGVTITCVYTASPLLARDMVRYTINVNRRPGSATNVSRPLASPDELALRRRSRGNEPTIAQNEPTVSTSTGGTPSTPTTTTLTGGGTEQNITGGTPPPVTSTPLGDRGTGTTSGTPQTPPTSGTPTTPPPGTSTPLGDRGTGAGDAGTGGTGTSTPIGDQSTETVELPPPPTFTTVAPGSDAPENKTPYDWNGKSTQWIEDSIRNIMGYPKTIYTFVSRWIPSVDLTDRAAPVDNGYSYATALYLTIGDYRVRNLGRARGPYGGQVWEYCWEFELKEPYKEHAIEVSNPRTPNHDHCPYSRYYLELGTVDFGRITNIIEYQHGEQKATIVYWEETMSKPGPFYFAGDNDLMWNDTRDALLPNYPVIWVIFEERVLASGAVLPRWIATGRSFDAARAKTHGYNDVELRYQPGSGGMFSGWTHYYFTLKPGVTPENAKLTTDFVDTLRPDNPASLGTNGITSIDAILKKFIRDPARE